MERKLWMIAATSVGAAILIAAAIVVVRLKPQYPDDQADEAAALKAAESIDPAKIGYHEAGTFAVAFRQPRALAVDASGQIYVGGDRAVVRCAGDGRKLAEIALEGEPQCLAFGAPIRQSRLSCSWRWKSTSKFTTRRACASRSGRLADRKLSLRQSPRPSIKSGLPMRAIASSGGSMPRVSC